MTGCTGLGSLPGVDPGAAARVAVEDVDLPWLLELPGRGPWAGLVGRGTALLSGLSTELLAGEWRLAATAGVDARRAKASLRNDLDVLEETAHDYDGPLKVSVCGPWTLASSLFLPLGGRVLGDRGARRDLAQSLTAGVGEFVGEVARRLPNVEVRLQVDEPSLSAVLAGRVPTEGGYFRHRSVSQAEVAEHLEPLAHLTPDSLVHSCAPDVPLALLRAAGFAGISLDGSLLDRQGWDAVAASVESGMALYLGVADAAQPPTGPDALVRRTLDWLRPLELGPVLADRLWLTHTCGLAGASVAQVRPALAALRRAAALVDDALRS